MEPDCETRFLGEALVVDCKTPDPVVRMVGCETGTLRVVPVVECETEGFIRTPVADFGAGVL